MSPWLITALLLVIVPGYFALGGHVHVGGRCWALYGHLADYIYLVMLAGAVMLNISYYHWVYGFENRWLSGLWIGLAVPITIKAWFQVLKALAEGPQTTPYDDHWNQMLGTDPGTRWSM